MACFGLFFVPFQRRCRFWSGNNVRRVGRLDRIAVRQVRLATAGMLEKLDQRKSRAQRARPAWHVASIRLRAHPRDGFVAIRPIEWVLAEGCPRGAETKDPKGIGVKPLRS